MRFIYDFDKNTSEKNIIVLLSNHQFLTWNLPPMIIGNSEPFQLFKQHYLEARGDRILHDSEVEEIIEAWNSGIHVREEYEKLCSSFQDKVSAPQSETKRGDFSIKRMARTESSEDRLWTDDKRLIKCSFSYEDNVSFSNYDHGTHEYNNNNCFSLLYRYNNQLLRRIIFQNTIPPDVLEKFIRIIKTKKRNINNCNNDKKTADKCLIKYLEYAGYTYIKALFTSYNLFNNEPNQIKMALHIAFGLQPRQTLSDDIDYIINNISSNPEMIITLFHIIWNCIKRQKNQRRSDLRFSIMDDEK
ncbi:hypothetical protein C1646_810407 [Rhizophagus diaphanus]|nr:hypothetical protein C1646_810407 [Rhizophagus diaphanus] [Rhizophagus sp. MUCL 43196]